MSERKAQVAGVRRLWTARTRATKWVLGLLLAGLAAAVTSYATGAIRSGVDAARDLFEEEAPPVGITLSQGIQAGREAKLGSAHWLFTRPINALPYPNSGDLTQIPAWDAWARQHGGIEADKTGVEVVIEGKTQYPVVLTALTVEVVRRDPPPKAILVAPFGGGPVGDRHFQVNLDASPPTVEALPDEFNPVPAVDFPYQVSQTDPEVFLIVAHALKCDCSWRARLHWVYHGQTGSTVIDQDGQPFRTASAAGKTATYLAQNGRFEKSQF